MANPFYHSILAVNCILSMQTGILNIKLIYV